MESDSVPGIGIVLYVLVALLAQGLYVLTDRVPELLGALWTNVVAEGRAATAFFRRSQVQHEPLLSWGPGILIACMIYMPTLLWHKVGVFMMGLHLVGREGLLHSVCSH